MSKKQTKQTAKDSTAAPTAPATVEKQKQEKPKDPVALVLEREAKARLNLAEIEPSKRAKVVKLDSEFRMGLAAVGVATLKLGEILYKIREQLDESFKGYLGNFPSLSRSTAYRWINLYEIAKLRLPKAVVAQALVNNMDIVSQDKDNPFGKFTPIVKAIGTPKIDSDDTSQDALKKADQWLNEVRVKAKAAGIKNKGNKKEHNLQDLVKDSFRNLARNVDKLEGNKQLKFVKAVVGMLLTYTDFDGPETFSLVAVPDDYISSRSKKNQEAESEDE